MNIRAPLLDIAQLLTDAAFPARCMSCFQEGTWYCDSCRRNSSPHVLSCMGCKEPNTRGTTCTSCKEDIPLSGLVTARPYSDRFIRRGIEWFKFKGVRPLADILAALLIPQLPHIAPLHELSRRALLVPIPLHSKKYSERGFNQSEDIARSIGTVCDIAVASLLVRNFATASQASLPAAFRQENMHDAFRLAVSREEYAHLVAQKPIVILIDDVATSGATLVSAAHTLPPHTQVQVWAAAVAKG